MKKILLAVALAVAVAIPVVTLAAGWGAATVPGKSPNRYITQTYTFSSTTTITGAVIGVVPPGGARLKGVILGQAAAGTGGTSWSASPKVNGTALCSTLGVISLSDGANKAVNDSVFPVQLAKPAGATRPVIKVDGTAAAAGGSLITIDVTLTGAYSVAVTGSVTLLWDANL